MRKNGVIVVATCYELSSNFVDGLERGLTGERIRGLRSLVRSPAAPNLLTRLSHETLNRGAGHLWNGVSPVSCTIPRNQLTRLSGGDGHMGDNPGALDKKEKQHICLGLLDTLQARRTDNHCTTNIEELRTNVIELTKDGLCLTGNGIPTGTMGKLTRFELDKDRLASG
ncbi:hypothetical protein DPMN_156010 [Dreissena polymorpha]|uniref:Uncharacterized protein n=1 Tax=Dreissena polymorpha TaxID=45954 RepID=A0A9D4FTL9_DREPO|nr:hypothetical protein DPMN_156010 [Dreissena polymorpha]